MWGSEKVVFRTVEEFPYKSHMQYLINETYFDNNLLSIVAHVFIYWHTIFLWNWNNSIYVQHFPEDQNPTHPKQWTCQLAMLCLAPTHIFFCEKHSRKRSFLKEEKLHVSPILHAVLRVIWLFKSFNCMSIKHIQIKWFLKVFEANCIVVAK